MNVTLSMNPAIIQKLTNLSITQICSVANNASDRVQEKNYNIVHDFGGKFCEIKRQVCGNCARLNILKNN